MKKRQRASRSRRYVAHKVPIYEEPAEGPPVRRPKVEIVVMTDAVRSLTFRAMNPAPKIAITRFGAGVHSFWKPEKDLPAGIVPSVIKS